MSVKLQVIMEALEQLAPRRLAEEWDRVGLQLGQGAQEIRRVLVALDVTEAVAAETAAQQEEKPAPASETGSQDIITNQAPPAVG